MARKTAKAPETVTVMIEIPKGSRNKYEFDPETRRIKFDRMLFSSVHYPCDYGFVMDTLAGDGDALDALVIVAEPTFPGCIIEAKPVGVFIMEDEKGRDEKILCVPVRDPLWNHIQSLDELQPHLLKEIQHFFKIYKDLEHKYTKVKGWYGLKEATQCIQASYKAFQKNLDSIR
ncbi:MAG: inorganic diphosphatase [Candidatus Omnitrophica bacterium]|nr:inorganic diphosphatase [Candidatus Omnitrophota bacterium]